MRLNSPLAGDNVKAFPEGVPYKITLIRDRAERSLIFPDLTKYWVNTTPEEKLNLSETQIGLAYGHFEKLYINNTLPIGHPKFYAAYCNSKDGSYMSSKNQYNLKCYPVKQRLIQGGQNEYSFKISEYDTKIPESIFFRIGLTADETPCFSKSSSKMKAKTDDYEIEYFTLLKDGIPLPEVIIFYLYKLINYYLVSTGM